MITSAGTGSFRTAGGNISLSGTNQLQLLTGNSLNSEGGNITISGGAVATTGSTFNTGDGNFSLNATTMNLDTGSISTGSGNIALTSVNELAVDALQTTSGSITLTSSSGSVRLNEDVSSGSAPLQFLLSTISMFALMWISALRRLYRIDSYR